MASLLKMAVNKLIISFYFNKYYMPRFQLMKSRMDGHNRLINTRTERAKYLLDIGTEFDRQAVGRIGTNNILHIYDLPDVTGKPAKVF